MINANQNQHSNTNDSSRFSNKRRKLSLRIAALIFQLLLAAMLTLLFSTPVYAQSESFSDSTALDDLTLSVPPIKEGQLGQSGIPTETFLKVLGGIHLILIAGGIILLIWSFSLRKQVVARTKSMELEIQERKQMEAALKESNDKFLSLVGNVPGHIAYVNANTLQYEFVNDAFEKSFGIPREKIIGSHIQEIIGEKNYQFALKYINEVRSGRSISYENTFELISGRRWIQVNYAPVFDAGGQVTSIVVLSYDITERKQTEEALRVSQSRLHLAINAGNIGIWDWNIVKDELTWEDSMYSLYGIQKDDFGGAYDAWFRTLHPDDRQQTNEEIQAALRGKREFTHEFRVVRPDGTIRFFKAFSQTMRDQDGNALRMIGINYDITERKQAEEKLQESEKRIQLKLNNLLSPDGDLGSLELADIINVQAIQELMDVFYKITRFAVAIIDLEGRVLVGTGWQDVCTQFHRVHPQTLKRCIECDTVLSRNVPPGAFKAYQCKNGMWDIVTPLMIGGRHVGNLFTGQLFFNDTPPDYELFRAQAREYGFDEDAYMAAVRRAPHWDREDINLAMDFYTRLAHIISNLSHSNLTLAKTLEERKRAEEEIDQLNAELEQRVEERTMQLRNTQEQLVRQERLALLGQLAGSVGHELRNPLGVISNAIYFLKMAQPDASEKIKEYLNIIENETHTSDKIVTDLLDFTRIKSLDRAPASVSELIRQTLEHYPAPPSVEVKLEIPNDMPQIFADPHHVVQILGNLVANAYQAMVPTDSIPDDVNEGKLTLSASTHNDMLNISIKDTGIGIPPENIQKLFEPLFTTKAKGIGLGLAVSRKLAEANGGRIEVQSEAGTGSTFNVYLPVYREEK